MKPDVAFYYPGQYWYDADWVKNLICFFDGIAMLIPEYMEDHLEFDDYPIVSALKDHDLFRVIRPEEVIDAKATEALAEALAEVINSGGLDHLTEVSDKDTRQSNFGSLSMSRLGYYGDGNLADSIFQELKSRGLAEDSVDGVSIPMHTTVRSLILVLLAQILRPKGESMGLTLSPATDQKRVVSALSEIILRPNSSSPSVGDVVSFDIDKVGVNLGPIPIDEILDFRNQHYRQHRDYIQSIRDFARELSYIPSDERKVKFEQRQEQLEDLSSGLRKVYSGSWKKEITFGIGLTTAALTYQSDPIVAVLLAVNAIVGMVPDKSQEVDVYSYLFSTKQRFG